MIKIDIKAPSKDDLTRALMVEVERLITKQAKDAAKRHGGVTVRFSRMPVGNIRNIQFHGSEAAIEAAKAAVGNNGGHR